MREETELTIFLYTQMKSQMCSIKKEVFPHWHFQKIFHDLLLLQMCLSPSQGDKMPQSESQVQLRAYVKQQATILESFHCIIKIN